MTGVIFTIPGKPFGKQRHRVNMAQRRTFDTAANRGFARTAGLIARPHFPRPLDGPVSVWIDAAFAMPKSWSREMMNDHEDRAHTQKPDADNIAKAICDALNGIAWTDDAQVAELHITKRWRWRADTRVRIHQIRRAS